MTRTLGLLLVAGLLLLAADAARAAGPFESLQCLRYADAKDYPVDAILYGTDRTYRNIEDDIALGLGLDLYESVRSFARIRQLAKNGILIPGHEPRMFTDPGTYGFRKVSDRIVAIVE